MSTNETSSATFGTLAAGNAGEYVGRYESGHWRVESVSDVRMVSGFYTGYDVGPLLTFTVDTVPGYASFYRVSLNVSDWMPGDAFTLTYHLDRPIQQWLMWLMREMPQTSNYVGYGERIARRLLGYVLFEGRAGDFRLPGLDVAQVAKLNEDYPYTNEDYQNRVYRLVSDEYARVFSVVDYETRQTLATLKEEDERIYGYDSDAAKAWDMLRTIGWQHGDYVRFVWDAETRNVFVSYLPASKPSGGDGFSAPGRMRVKLGRFIRRISPETSDARIEEMVNATKAHYIGPTIRVTYYTGPKVLWGYNEANYAPRGIGDLANSCMRYDYAQDYVQWYAENPDSVSLAVALDEHDRVYGRTLVWNDRRGNKYHDRVYGSDDVCKAIRAYLKSDGIERGSSSAGIEMTPASNDMYPYMDTYQYARVVGDMLVLLPFQPDDGWFSYYELTSTRGEYYETNLPTCDECGDTIPTNDVNYAGGLTLCESCFDDGRCEHCREYTLDPHDVNGTRLCGECHSEYVCPECGGYDSDGLVSHNATGESMCESCHDSRCYLCGDDGTGGDWQTACVACMDTPVCVECGEYRQQGSIGAYCPTCSPRQGMLPGMPHPGTGTFRNVLGQYTYSSEHPGYSTGLSHYRPDYSNVYTWETCRMYPLPEYDSLIYRRSHSVSIFIP